MSEPSEALNDALQKAMSKGYESLKADQEILDQLNYVCRCINNRAEVRLLMACLLAKIHNSKIDPTKPYTEIGGNDCFSGRTIDERYISVFIADNDLPCNPTTAFLTPALRNIDHPLSKDMEIIGRPRQVYTDTIELLYIVRDEIVSAQDMLTEVIFRLIQYRDEQQNALSKKISELAKHSEDIILSSEEIITLINQHLACKYSSRLPVLIVAAAYECCSSKTGESIKQLLSHNAADEQTGSLGDVEVCLVDDEERKVLTAYEMKMKRIMREDIDRAIQKIANSGYTIDNYIFITTEIIDEYVNEYAKGMYEKLGQREIAILDCIGFIRHFLHFFHRSRKQFLDEYQTLLLNEPDSAVRHDLKEVFLDLRKVAENRE